MNPAPPTRTCLRLLFCALLATPLCGTAQGQPASLDKLAWLGGCWAAVGGEPGSGEQWLPLAGGTLLGVNRTVKGGKTVAHEFMQIRTGDDGRLAFIAQPSDQAPTRFPLVRQSSTEAVFEQAGHDFPQRVIYASDDGQLLRARIEGKVDGVERAINFPLRRVACETPAAGAAR